MDGYSHTSFSSHWRIAITSSSPVEELYQEVEMILNRRCSGSYSRLRNCTRSTFYSGNEAEPQTIMIVSLQGQQLFDLTSGCWRSVQARPHPLSAPKHDRRQRLLQGAEARYMHRLPPGWQSSRQDHSGNMVRRRRISAQATVRLPSDPEC